MGKSTRESRRSARKAGRARLPVVTAGAGKVVSSAGGVLLLQTARAAGVDMAMSKALAPWRPRLARHDPAKILLDLAVALAMGGDALADIAALRVQPGVFGPVASDPTVSRLINRLAADASQVLAAIASARAAARARVWELAGGRAPDHQADADDPVVADLDATLVTAHSEKESAAKTYKKGFGFHPIGAWADHGPDGTGEALAMILRPGNAGANTADDHIAVTQKALAQLPGITGRPGRKVLVRTDGAGGAHRFLQWLTAQRVQYSIGFGLTETIVGLVDGLPDTAWTPAYNADRVPREGAWVAELTGLADLKKWPQGMRADHPRGTAPPGRPVTVHRLWRQPADRVRHQHPPRPVGRSRTAPPPPGTLRGPHPRGERRWPDQPPLHDFAQNQIWMTIVMLAQDLLAWLQLLGLHDHDARRWEPKTLRYRIFSIAGRRGRSNRRPHLWLAAMPYTALAVTAAGILAALDPG